jgi:glutaredoxin-like protein
VTLLNETIQKQLKQVFEPMTGPVTLVMFTQSNDGVVSIECGMCADTRQLIEEVAALSDKIDLKIYDFVNDEATAQAYNIDKIPALVVLGGPEQKDYGIRLYGIPSGYEFGTLIEDILMASKGNPDLSVETMAEVSKLDQPVHIQVFTTPT